MKKLEPIIVDLASLEKELAELEKFLIHGTHLKERAQVLPFFKERKNLTAALGMLSANIASPQLYAHELQLFGDFAADAASGDQDENSVALIEFENAEEHSIFTKLEHGKTIKRYAPRFEHGFSQLVDWAWRLASEVNADAYARVFGNKLVNVTYMLIIGRDDDLTSEDLLRLQWRSKNVSISGAHVQCYTFDHVLKTLRRRIGFANASPVAITGS